MNRLLTIQQKLKAPKSQFNDFGKYKYRNCEDILEALKPLLQETETILTATDELAMIGTRYYVRATVTLKSAVDGKVIDQAVAYAREEETKKGMDASQITGTASTYARKYAMNGLLSIDDTRDADSTQRPPEPAPKSSAQPKSQDTYAAPPDTDHQNRVDIGNMLMEMCGFVEDAATMLEHLTTFTGKEGNTVKGKNSVKALSEKQVPIVLRRVKEQYEKWQAVQEQPPVTDDFSFDDEF
jgi:hypothetical protein